MTNDDGGTFIVKNKEFAQIFININRKKFDEPKI